MSVTKRASALILTILLIVALVGGGGLAILGTQQESGRVQNEIRDLNAATSDLTNLGAVASISGKGSIGAGGGPTQVLSILNSLRDHKCCVLDGDFAVPALNALSHYQLVLVDERSQISDKTLVSDTARALQSAMLNAYASNEKLARDASQVITGWAETFGEEKRESRIKALEDVAQAGLVEYTAAQQKIDQQIGQARSQQDTVSAQLKVLQASQDELQTRSYLFIAPIVLGIVLAIVLILVTSRSRKVIAQVASAEAHTKRTAKKKRS